MSDAPEKWKVEFRQLEARVLLEHEAKDCAEAGYSLAEMESICGE